MFPQPGSEPRNAGAISELLANPSVFGLWEIGMGALLLYVGINMLGYRQVWTGLRQQLA